MFYIAVFHDRGNEAHTFATALQAQGYATAFMGKYLNGYLPKDLYTPPGWTEWYGAGNAYGEYDYNLNENGTLVHYGDTDADYLTDVVGAKGRSFIKRTAAAPAPTTRTSRTPATACRRPTRPCAPPRTRTWSTTTANTSTTTAPRTRIS
ncbi:sulfatase-like hydrolase/transferase [Dactylosporangium matsuzakiense]|uniref:Uncharacterized protein n=1 Tax=Dactylosporangium matsuzakiense TaxID=53360 RepID=A0A9W6KVY0_9ACTN|nr:sulfatase-like hydrolase/transferase [Dactylosporangium matsuzakiense]UWZ48623.1 sulfatase-like hydrolase/transferase [Dactylosporangium matsuzakiense]GLL06459.1 hypothetical protein GCM10017581_082090 [Dactylosporangium matsuzakiense]